ncbi:MAG: DUF349 domain-containing protein [Erysipelotrichaceae bacterium]|nr:DUF349 domain-containing protein [Erysipelotrichaceae bacterium]
MYEKRENWRRSMFRENEEVLLDRDLDEEIQKRKDLVEEVKQLSGDNWQDTSKKLNQLKRRWKQISYWESAYEDQLEEEFNSYVDALYKKNRESNQMNAEKKEALIAEARKLMNTSDFKVGTNEMNELMNQWKAVGSADKETDDALWAQFNEARQVFFDRKHQNWEETKAKFAQAKEKKQELIEKAQALQESTEWQKTNDALKALLEEWKTVGNAGKEFDQELWQQFQAARQVFYERRNQYYDELHATQNQHYEAKAALVQQVQEIVDAKSYTKEHTERVRELQAQWKTIGSCGKEKEDEIWGQFRGLMDEYYSGLKQWNEERHNQWRQRMLDARKRKLELIDKQKRQLQYMKQDMVGLLSQRAIDDMQERMADKEDFIAELENDIKDIDEKLAK